MFPYESLNIIIEICVPRQDGSICSYDYVLVYTGRLSDSLSQIVQWVGHSQLAPGGFRLVAMSIS